MRRTKQRLGVYTVLLFLLIAATVTLRTLALLWDFDFEFGYFGTSVAATASDWVLIAGSVLLISFVAVGGVLPLRASFSSSAFYLPSGLVGVALLFLSADYFKKVFIMISERAHLGFGIFNADTLLPLAVALLSLLSIGYLFLGALAGSRNNARRSLFGTIAAVFFSVYAIYLYFDPTLPINAPTKVLDEMAYVFTSAFFLFETRISLGRDKWNAYLGFGMTAALLTAASSLPALIVYLVRGELTAHSLSEAVLTLTLFIFTGTRVLQALVLRNDKKNPMAQFAEMATAAKEERAELDAAEDEGDGEPDNYTMTFDGEAK